MARKAVRSGVVWGYLFAAYVAGSISGFALTYKTQAARQQLARSLGSNIGLQALIGPARHIDTVAGFASWRTSVTLSVIGGVWGLLASTRLLRGEEEAGRWELLLAGQTTRRRAGALGLAGLAAGWLVVLALTTLATVVDGRTVHPALAPAACVFYAVSVTCGAAMFLAVGALTSQLARTRRRAATMAGAVLGAAYVIRLVADAGTSLGWLRWASPLGWVEELRPLVGTNLLPLLPIAAFTGAVSDMAVRLAGARDASDGVLPESDTAPARTRLLQSSAGLGLRLLRPAAVAWLAAVAGIAFVEGIVAKGAAGAVTGSMQKALDRLGSRSAGEAAYLGLSFLLTAIALTFVAAGQAGANREEEASGRLDHLLVRPVGRWSWLGGRLAIEAAILVALGLLAGLATWVGAASQHGGVAFHSIVEGGLNAAPPALFLLGAATLIHGAVPRLVAPLTYGLIGWSFLIEFVGSVTSISHWVLDTSLLYHLAPVPAAPPRWGSAAAMVALGAAGAAVGAVLFRRRDLMSS